MSAKHSPGPWTFERVCFDSGIPIRGGRTVSGRPYNVARVNRPDTARFGEDYANARLIASAPELLDALSELRGAIVSGLCNSGTPAADAPDRLHNAIDAAGAAIANAVTDGGQ